MVRCLFYLYCAIRFIFFLLQLNSPCLSLTGLNEMEQRPIKPAVYIEGNVETGEDLRVVTKPSWSDHPLVVGPRYTPKNLACEIVNRENYHTSGLLVVGMGPNGLEKAEILKQLNYLKTYEVHGLFGKATHNFFFDGRTTERTTYTKKSMTRSRFDFFLNKMTADHRFNMIRSCGVDPDSQAAYELLSQGQVRPFSNQTDPIVYKMRCISFKVPEFVLSIQAVNVSQLYLGQLVHRLGISMRSTAHVTKLRCVQLGPFNVDSALLDKYLTAKNVLKNINILSNIQVDEETMRRETARIRPS